jgi:hypothetical protein
LPAAFPEHERIEVPEPPEMLVDDIVQDRFDELVATAKATVPANPLSGVTLMVEVPVTPVLTVTVVELAAIV